MGTAMRPGNQEFMAQSATIRHGSLQGTRFALTKFRPPPLPATLIARSAFACPANRGS